MIEFKKIFEEIGQQVQTIQDGNLASYIPELANVNPQQFAMAVVTVDGKCVSFGDDHSLFTLQSTSKPFTYGLALEEHGEAFVHSRIGVEPSGEAFNSIIELEKKTHRPFNPMINSGAIAVANMIQDKESIDREQRVLSLFSELAGRKLDYNHEVFLSEKKTAHRNRAIAHLLRHFEVIGDDIEESLDLYFKQCSIDANVKDLAAMAATLANNGLQPLTNKRIYKEENITRMISLMFTCGMYDSAGTWAYTVGIPAKSGVSGALFGVVPGKMGIACFSPLIDSHGHSLKGVHAMREFAKKLGMNIFR